ncbi:MAG: cell envelope integrity protein CreD [Thermodesulfobacteriota bacterium]
MEEQGLSTKLVSLVKNSASVKIGVIGFIILILLIPGSMISSLIHEREVRRNGVLNEISNKWGGDQLVSGPVISVPFKVIHHYDTKKPVIETKYLHFLPEVLDIKGSLNPQIRHRGIFEAPLYHATLDIKGSFAPLDLDKLLVNKTSILWDKAFLSMGIRDMAGIRQQMKGFLDDKEVVVNPGIITADVFSSGVSVALDIKPGRALAFHFQLQLNGSEELQFLPMGQNTKVNLKSPWQNPSFSGEFLPTDYEISETGFEANWLISHFNRNYPQSWQGSRKDIWSSGFGVKMYQGTDIYQKTTRTSKYSLMFIVFSFTAFFLAEVLTKGRVHPVQYLLVGFAITCFYTLLLALSEHVGFNLAFMVASLAVIGLVGAYTRSILGSRMALVTSSLLIFLYTYLFITLQLEDYALLMGSIGLFALLGLVMYVTRKVDWYCLHGEPDKLEG